MTVFKVAVTLGVFFFAMAIFDSDSWFNWSSKFYGSRILVNLLGRTGYRFVTLFFGATSLCFAYMRLTHGF